MADKKDKDQDVKLKLKFSDDGSVALDSDRELPIFINQDGEEVVFDVAKLYNDKRAANAESAGRRKRIEELETRLTDLENKYNGLDDPESARKALETLQSIDQQKLMDTEGVESVKRQMREAFDMELKKLREDWESQLTEKTEILGRKGDQIRKLLIESAFHSSDYLRSKTLLPADVAYARFGDHFEVRENSGQPMAVGRYKGEDIYSRRNPGELATPEEAIEFLIDKYPNKQ